MHYEHYNCWLWQSWAEKLNNDGNEVTVIDLSAENVRAVTDVVDVMGIVGNGAKHTTLHEAGIEKADLFIAVTNSDELNLLCCMIARKEGKCKTIARVKNPEYSADAPYLQAQLGLAMVINPEYAPVPSGTGIHWICYLTERGHFPCRKQPRQYRRRHRSSCFWGYSL